MRVYQLSSLSKVFPDKIYGDTVGYIDAVKGQTVSYQIAIENNENAVQYNIKSGLEKYINVSLVGYVPMSMPTYESCKDEDYLTKEKCMCPDPLYPFKDNIIKPNVGFTTLWLDIELPKDIEPESYSISVEFFENGKNVTSTEMKICVHNYVLPKQEIYFTQWFHTDCIADVHNVEVFSEEHWDMIEKYISLASKHGINMILTPVLTPPLDTAVGGERTTTQLVEIKKENEKYSFEFSKLERFIDICLKSKIEYFEINHMFTQWGAKNAPKVIANVNGVEQKIFGWETDASSNEYKDFLSQLIPALINVFLAKGIEKRRLFFHVSDEPSLEHLEAYKSAYKSIEKLIEGCRQIDAMSCFEFYKEKIVKTPIVATSNIEPFLEANVDNLWCYYCCAQHEQVSNRFMAMPSYRNRIIGVQMYKCSIVGFLHWGYNFYNLQYSKGKINPYEVTDAGGSFPSGDSFSVYPYENQAIPSIRLKVFKNALDDIRLLTLLEKKIGKKSVIDVIDRVANTEVTFKSYPKNEKFFSKLYAELFSLLSE